MRGGPGRWAAARAEFLAATALGVAIGVAVTGAEPLDVVITSPPAGQPTFGTVEVAAQVYGEAVRVELHLDGRPAGERQAPPYRWRVDLGEENQEHRFEVRAFGPGGESDEAVLVSPAIHIDDEVSAELRQLYVTVSDGGRRILDLRAADFTILDNGQPQELVTFSGGDVRVTAALLLDASASMQGGRLRTALAGATQFIRRMLPDDEAALMVFADRLLAATPFSGDLGALSAQLSGVRAEGGTALADHLYLALKRLEARQGRRVVVLLSDGVDSHSTLTMADVAWLARRSRALVYWIRTDPRDRESLRYSAWKDPRLYRAEYEQLTRIVADSGGRILTLDSLDEAAGAFQELLRELREQYVLGYYPSQRAGDGRWHQTFVRVHRVGLSVRAQAGYVDD